MSGLSFAVDWTDQQPLDALVARMAAAVPHRGDTRPVVAGDGRAAAAALGSGTGSASDASGRLIVADTRLDEVDELSRRLGRDTGQLSEAELVLAAYDRWSDDCADQLRGDFSFVIWDPLRSEIFAARDIFGMRPLFYSSTDGRFVAGSEIAQVLRRDETKPQLNERSVVASLIGRSQSPRWTPFEGIRRLPPGRVLRADANGVRTRAYWRPPREADTRPASGEEYAEELRRLLALSVRARLDASSSPGLLLSSGIDSTSIAATAAELARADSSIPTLATYSFGYDGFPDADEREVSGLLAVRNGQPNTVIPADDAFPLSDFDSRHPDVDGPELLQSHALMRRSLARARADGVELMMTGHRGDPLFGEGVFDYLGVLTRKGPRALWRQAGAQASREETTTRAVLQRDLVRRMPAAAWPRYRSTEGRDWLRKVVPGGPSRPPWVSKEAIRGYELETAAADAVPLSRLVGDARRRRHEALLQPSHALSAEYLERLNAEAGVRYTDPWSDRRIADWVLAIPTDRITVDGTPKWLLREAMRESIPEFARNGSFVAHPGSFYEYGLLKGGEAAVESLLTDPVTAARGYVDVEALRSSYARYQTGAWPGLAEWNAFWRWVALEQWVRAHDL